MSLKGDRTKQDIREKAYQLFAPKYRSCLPNEIYVID